MTEFSELQRKEIAIEKQLEELLQSRSNVRTQMRRMVLESGVRAAIFDHDVLKTSVQQWFCMQGMATNMVVPGEVRDRDVPVYHRLGRFIVGAHPDTLTRWARQIHATINVAYRMMLDLPLWLPPDAVLSAEEMCADLKKSESPQRGRNAAAGVPHDWVFLVWDIAPTIDVAARQGLSVTTQSYTQDRFFPGTPDALPPGEARFILDGAVTELRDDGPRDRYVGVEALPMMLFDTVDLRKGDPPCDVATAIAFGIDNLGRSRDTNLQAVSQLASDGRAHITEVLVGIPTEQFVKNQAARLPPHTMQMEICGLLEALHEPTENIHTVTGWTFSKFRMTTPVIIDARESVRVRVYGPPGPARVVMRGTLQRDIY
jgi:hypothetical protein